MKVYKEKRKVSVSVGKRKGLTLVLDLYSNRATLGTVAKNANAFNIFIGKVSKTIEKLISCFPTPLNIWHESVRVGVISKPWCNF